MNRFWASQRNFQILLYVQMLRETDRLDIENLDAAYAFSDIPTAIFFQKVFPDDPGTKRRSWTDSGSNREKSSRDIFRRDTFLANDADERYCGYCPSAPLRESVKKSASALQKKENRLAIIAPPKIRKRGNRHENRNI